MSTPSVVSLKRAISIAEQIERLKNELDAILRGVSYSPPPSILGLGAKKFTMSASARAKIAAAQKARWAKQKGKPAAAKKAPAAKKNGPKISAAGRARIAAAQKARWAKVKAAKK